MELPKFVYNCNICGLAGKMKHCGRCGSRSYCSVNCQKADWVAGHKDNCAKVDRGNVELGKIRKKWFNEVRENMTWQSIIYGMPRIIEDEITYLIALVPDLPIEGTRPHIMLWQARTSREKFKKMTERNLMDLGCISYLDRPEAVPLMLWVRVANVDGMYRGNAAYSTYLFGERLESTGNFGATVDRFTAGSMEDNPDWIPQLKIVEDALFTGLEKLTALSASTFSIPHVTREDFYCGKAVLLYGDDKLGPSILADATIFKPCLEAAQHYVE